MLGDMVIQIFLVWYEVPTGYFMRMAKNVWQNTVDLETCFLAVLKNFFKFLVAVYDVHGVFGKGRDK